MGACCGSSLTGPGDSYVGDIVDRRKHGRGVYTWKNGSVYDGQWEQDLAHGQGHFIGHDGEDYDGGFRLGKRHGLGTLRSANGDLYTGDFVRDVAHGSGSIEYANGDKYQGYWKEGKRQGYGVLEYAKTGQRYEGNWEADQRSGVGQLFFSENDPLYRSHFEGNWAANVRRGYGVLFFTNNAVYQGEWIEDHYLEGELQLPNGDKFVGTFSPPVSAEEEEASFRSGRMQFMQRREVYEGSFSNNKFHGQGKLTYSDGRVYSGEFKDGEPCGRGTLTFPSRPQAAAEPAAAAQQQSSRVASPSSALASASMSARSAPADYAAFLAEDAKESQLLAVPPLGDSGSLELLQNGSDEPQNSGSGSGGHKRARSQRLVLSPRARSVQKTPHVRVLEGNFEKGLPTGNCACVMDDGSRYDGQVRKFLPHGRGSCVFPDGNRYDGEWEDGLQHGNGIMEYVYDADGNKLDGVEKWEGRWSRGLPCGTSTSRAPSPRSSAISSRVSGRSRVSRKSAGNGGLDDVDPDEPGEGIGDAPDEPGAMDGDEKRLDDDEKKMDQGGGEEEFENGYEDAAVSELSDHSDEETFEEPNLMLAALRIVNQRVREAKLQANGQLAALHEEMAATHEMCCLCRNHAPNIVFLECRHCVVCHNCATVPPASLNCPACQAPVVRAIRTYDS